MGDATTTQRTTPVHVKGPGGSGFLTGVAAVGAGVVHTLAAKSDGTAWGWGRNKEGEVGQGQTSPQPRTSPVQLVGPGGVGFLTNVVQVSGGEGFSMAVKGDGTVWAWGRNKEGQLDNGGSSPQPVLTPQQVSTATGMTGIGRVEAGWHHTLAGSGSGAGPATQTTTYGYDRLSRLTTVDAPGSSLDTSYLYDPAGNRSTMTRGAATNYSYDRADRITAAGAVSYTVNASGNLVAKGADSFAFDQANRMKSATVSGATSTYAYNGDGVRHSKTVAAVTTTLVNDVNRGLPVVLDDGTRKYVYGLGLAYAVEGSAVLTYHTDGLGSVRATTDAAGAVTNTYKTDEFGVPVDSQGPSAQPHRYTGEPRDAESGLVYLRARYYDPGIGRFMGRDSFPGTAANSTSMNRYSYVQNNPVRLADPSGLCIDPAEAGIAYSGFAYCVDLYISEGVSGGMFLGDDRGPRSDGGTYRVRQFIWRDTGGAIRYSVTPGISRFIWDPNGGVQAETHQTCGAQKSRSLVDASSVISVICGARDPLVGSLAPWVSSYVEIANDGPNAEVRHLRGTMYPSTEVWQYGGAKPRLMCSYQERFGVAGAFLGMGLLGCN